jgi:hypothetical protein
MGLFKRRSKAATPAPATSTPAGGGQPSFGHAAFDPSDIEDARRGHPAVSLESFATANGWVYRGSELFGAFLSTLPVWSEYTFNTCRGTTSSGRFGMLAHELLELEAHNGSIRAGGTFFDVRVTTRMSLREMASISVPEPKNEPFATNAVWVPTTSVHVRTPEANLLPPVHLKKSGELTLGRSQADGLPGFRVTRGGDDPQTLAGVVGASRDALLTRNDPYVALKVRYGTVVLTVNGYRNDPNDLSHLIATADAIAEATARLVPAPMGRPLNEPGPAAGSISTARGTPLPHPVLVPLYASTAKRLHLHHEDPSFVRGLLPRCPIPGISSGVLFGTIPGTSVPGRVVWFEHGAHTTGTCRGGVIVAAVPGASTPVGGTLDERTATYTEIVDGVAYCWRQRRTVGELDADATIAQAVESLRSSGLAAL